MFDQIIDIVDAPVIGPRPLRRRMRGPDHRGRHDRTPPATGGRLEAGIGEALPKIYGDGLAVDSNHQITVWNDQPLDVIATGQRIAFIFNSARAELDQQAKLGGEDAGKRQRGTERARLWLNGWRLREH